MIRFFLLRREDETGVSGTGRVADGVIFEDGTVVLRWRTANTSTAVYDSIEKVKAVHGHGGKTIIVPIDHVDAKNKNIGELTTLCTMCFADLQLGQDYCEMCGASGCGIAIARGYAEMIQKHDTQRLESLGKKDEELRACRRVLFDLGLTKHLIGIRRFDEGGAVMGVELSYGQSTRRTTYCGEPFRGESEEKYIAREAERVELPPDVVRKLTK